MSDTTQRSILFVSSNHPRDDKLQKRKPPPDAKQKLRRSSQLSVVMVKRHTAVVEAQQIDF
jgi:hypothetical protein